MGGVVRRLRHAGLAMVVALFAPMVWVGVDSVPHASAADPGVAHLVAALDGSSNSLQSWTRDLATTGKLADALPLVQTSAGSVLGFPDLLDKWFTNGAH